ncbi:MAG: putative acyltransferase [Paracoccaceae bacterium]|jgi:predicted acyltransferase
MSIAVILAVAWVFAATAVAMLPMRRQYIPGSVLLISAPVLIGYLGSLYGWIAGIGALAAFLSMFRKPLRHFWRKWRGLKTGVPE